MSQDKHTPGPWHIGTLGDHTRVYDQGGAMVAHTGRSDFLDRASMEANARLIAAAPDLLEALKLARDALHSHDAEWPYMKAIHAALSKAQGTQS